MRLKKDPQIERRLNEYFTESPPQKDLISPALFVLREQNAQKANKPKRNAFKLVLSFGSAAAVIFITVLSVILFNMPDNGKTSNDVPDYSLEDLALSSYDDFTLPQNYAAYVPNIIDKLGRETQNNYSLYSKDNAAVLLKLTTRRFSGNTIEEVTIIIILEDIGLEISKDFQSLPLYQETPSYVVNSLTQRIDGEYVTNAIIEKDDLKYYLTVMSPEKADLNLYITFFN